MDLTRREVLSGLGAAGAALILPGSSRAVGAESAARSAQPFSFVHLTDMHVTPRRWGDKGYRACIESDGGRPGL
jgi:hypothetical protein